MKGTTESRLRRLEARRQAEGLPVTAIFISAAGEDDGALMERKRGGAWETRPVDADEGRRIRREIKKQEGRT